MRYTYERIGIILKELDKARFEGRVSLDGWEMQKTQQETNPEQAEKLSWYPAPQTEVWGGHFEYYVFRKTVVIPENFDGCTVELEIRTGKEGEWDAENPQFTAYVNGALVQGLDVNHRTIRLGEKVHAGESFRIFLSAFTGTQNFHLLFDSSLYILNQEVNQFYYDLLIPWQVAGLLDPEEEMYIRYMMDLNQVINLLDLRKIGSEEFLNSVRQAQQLLKQLYQENTSPDSFPLVCCIGHTHIDVAWLWTLQVTRDKAVRSFSTVLELMRRYPEYQFMSSQPQLYEYVKQRKPEIFAQIQERVKEGRWEPEGGMFVEADCNLSSGESLIRQFVYGKRFFRDEFDRDNEILWLPDAFGYSAALPQIMKKCGIRYFMTTKISWNDTDLLPVDTFLWRGIDGTQILTHLIPTRDYVGGGKGKATSEERNTAFTTNYNGFINPSQMKGAWQRYQQKELGSEVLCSFGYGDGGGGPTEEMLETERRLSQGLPGCPRTRQDSAENFFHRLEKEVEGKNIPLWNGELYLEYHRGTYTSMARNKKYNRKAEFALEDLETLSVMDQLLQKADYPQELLEEQWKTVLLNQFHDILPGSAIEPVYEESQQQYLALFDAVGKQTERTCSHLAEAAGTDLVFNLNGRPMSGFVKIPDNTSYPEAQRTWDGQYLAWAENVPTKGYRPLGHTVPSCGEVTVLERGIRTPFAEVLFDKTGRITSWYDRTADREILQKGMTAGLTAYEDIPFEYDNWNLESYYKEKEWPVTDLISTELVEKGPFRFTYQFIWKYQSSEITGHVSFYANSPQVDFELDVDWKEHHTLMKMLFPVDLNTTKAVYEIQYGNVERPTTKNISWEQAKFEVCHHKWMDLSEGDYGVSLLNDSKFGVSVDDNVVGLSLIKSGTYPNPHADQEKHHMAYSLLPHQGTWLSAGTVDHAYLLNNPFMFGKTAQAVPTEDAAQKNDSVHVMPTENEAQESNSAQIFDHAQSDRKVLPDTFQTAVCDADNVMIEVVKRADRSEDMILRLYEFGNCRAKTRVKLGFFCHEIWSADMLENPEQMLAKDTNEFELTFRPFEIRTILCRF